MAKCSYPRAQWQLRLMFPMLNALLESPLFKGKQLILFFFFSVKNTVVVRTWGLENRPEVKRVSEHHGQLVQQISTFFAEKGRSSGKSPYDWRDHTAAMYENTPWQAILRGKGAHIILFFFIVNPQLAEIWVPVIVAKTADRFSIEKSLRGHRNKPGTRNQVSSPKWVLAALSRGTLPCFFPYPWVLTLSNSCSLEQVLSSKVSLNLLTAETHQFESIWLRRDQPIKLLK